MPYLSTGTEPASGAGSEDDESARDGGCGGGGGKSKDTERLVLGMEERLCWRRLRPEVVLRLWVEPQRLWAEPLRLWVEPLRLWAEPLDSEAMADRIGIPNLSSGTAEVLEENEDVVGIEERRPRRLRPVVADPGELVCGIGMPNLSTAAPKVGIGS
jgi:hypothetical protein